MLMFYGLLIYTFAIYGLSWLITQSYLLQSFRSLFEELALSREGKLGGYLTNRLAYLVNCIVCTSVWVGLVILMTADHSALLSQVFPPVNMYDLILWSGWNVTSVWGLANLFDDAD